MKILKYDFRNSEESQKYLAKLIEYPKIIHFIFPNYKVKLSTIEKCLGTSKLSEDDFEEPNSDNIVEKIVKLFINIYLIV